MKRYAVVLIALCGVVASSCDSGGTASGPKLGPNATAGQTAANELGCVACHSSDGESGTGPSWKGVWDTEIELKGGEKVTADSSYIERAILHPNEQVRSGFAAMMPEYGDRVSAEQARNIAAYICDLGPKGPQASCETLP
jgi:cytochrome c oxidase subunit 2